MIVNGELVAEGWSRAPFPIADSEVGDASGALVGGGVAPPSGALSRRRCAPPSGALVAAAAPTPGGDNGVSPCSDDLWSPLRARLSAAAPRRRATTMVRSSWRRGHQRHRHVRRRHVTGDGIVINDGIITARISLSGATVEGGNISGTVTSVRISPSN